MVDPHQALRDDIRLLGDLLGRTLVEQEGPSLFRTVEQIRQLTKSIRLSDTRRFPELETTIARLSANKAGRVARAFAHFLNLANIAEQRHRIRRRGEYRADPAAHPQRGSLADGFSRLRAVGTSAGRIYRTISTLEIDLVLTAHPTQVMRRVLLQKYNRIAQLLEDRECHREALHREITAIWMTDDISRSRPTPQDEAKGGLYVIEQSLWHVVPRFLRELDHEVRQTTGKALPLTATPLQFSSWMGGDRDGNPAVTAAVTQEVVLLNRWMAAELYGREMVALRQELSMEPYRARLKAIALALQETQHRLAEAMSAKRLPAALPIATRADLERPLMACYRQLCAQKGKRLAEGRLLDCLRLLQTFGVSLVRLDIRQEASCHHRPVLKDVRDTLRLVAKLGTESFGAYVISMARTPEDVFRVVQLQRTCGVQRPLRVVPLFERVDDLQQAPATMTALFANRAYVRSLRGHQEIMIGYSDSAKDAGRLAAAWQLYQTQRQLVQVCRRHKIALTLFHGRGGTIGRGGGPAHMAVLSQPPGSINGRLRVTEQGEMIQAKFGLPGIAQRTLELYTTSVLEATLSPPRTETREWRRAMNALSQHSSESFRTTIAQRDFLPYYHAITPLDALGRIKIASRPTHRHKKRTFENLRAIPWVFAWTQNRLMLPAWLGMGEALAAAIDAGDLPMLQDMYREWPFFRVTLDLIEMVLAKAELVIAAHYAHRLAPKHLHPLGTLLLERFALTKQALLQITEHQDLLEDNPVLRRSIRVRNPYIDPINFVQVEALRHWRQARNKRPWEEVLLLTINGIAAGMRNAG
jgi:phosphoenolpyruvate carboxylase